MSCNELKSVVEPLNVVDLTQSLGQFSNVSPPISSQTPSPQKPAPGSITIS